MPGFLTAVDIANRALQHCGQSQLPANLGFSEVSKRATETSAVYDKLRRAELRRNSWRFSIKTAILRPLNMPTLQPTSTPNPASQYPSMILQPFLWASTTTYQQGSVVEDAHGFIWISLVSGNINNAPGNSPAWDLYYGPMDATPYDTTGATAYMAGDLVYTTPGNGTYQVWLSRITANSNVPTAVQAWSATAVYSKDAIVSFSAVNYQSLIDLNINQQPSAANSPPAFSLVVTYAAAQLVTGSDGFIYTSNANGNVGHDPTADATHIFWTPTGNVAIWTTTLTRVAGDDGWMNIAATLGDIMLDFPIGFNVSSFSSGRRVFRLPANYLRRAPQDPKAGSSPWLGAPTGNAYLDWDFQGDYLITRMSNPIAFRFCADVSNVQEMDEMFCEGLAARIAYAVCPSLTQSSQKLNDIASAYGKFMGEARIINAIETGVEEEPEDDYIVARA